MNMYSPSAILLASLMLATGCSTVPPQKLEQIPAHIQKGSTTSAQVRQYLGAPHQRRIHPEGETWFYGNARDRGTGAVVFDQAVGIGLGFIPIPYLGTAIGGARSIGRSAQGKQPGATIDLDKRGIVRDYAIDLP